MRKSALYLKLLWDFAPFWLLGSMLFTLVGVRSGLAQAATGLPPFGTFNRDAIDTVNVGNLNVHFQFPIFAKPGRAGLNYTVNLVHDNMFSVGVNNNNFGNPPWSFPELGWGAVSPLGGGLRYTTSTITCNGNTNDTVYSNFYYIDANNTAHSFIGAQMDTLGCKTLFNGTSYDGWSLTTSTFSVKDPSGNTHSSASITDPNGNKISSSYTFSGLSYNSSDTDATGATVFTVQTTYDSSNHAVSSTFSYPAVGGTTWEPISTVYTVFTPKTAFGCPAVDDVTGATVGLPTSISLPDGTSYTIVYESLSGTYPSTITTGRIHTLTMPSGAVITYTYSGGTNSINCQDGSPAILTKQTPDGTWVYKHSFDSVTNLWTTIMTDPAGNDTVYTFSSTASPGMTWPTSNVELQRQSYQGSYTSPSPTLLQSRVNCYNGNTSNCATTWNIIEPLSQISATTTLDSGQSSKTVKFLNLLGLPTEVDEYDFGASTATRKTLTAYASPGNNILNRPSSVIVQDGSGNQISKTTYGYDEYGSPGRGNMTSQQVWLNTSGTTLDSHWKYDNNGQIVQSQVPAGVAGGTWTQYGYDATTDACLTSTTLPTPASGVTLATSQVCDASTGLVTSTTDFNNIKTTYSYDAMLRQTGITVNNGTAVVANATRSYSGSSLPETVTTTVIATPSPNQVSTTTLDGLGRIAKTVAPNGATVATTYDSMGRLATVSNPYFTTADPTYGLTSFTYDALGRKLLQCQPDNGNNIPCVAGASYLQWSYAGNITTFYDESRNSRQLTSDALGRLTNVVEPGNLTTNYTYNTLDNLTYAHQGGVLGERARDRYFSYDSLSRLTKACNPEVMPTGTLCDGATIWSATYSYDLNSNVATKTDNRNVATTYSYDALNRLTGKVYSGSDTLSSAIAAATPSTCFQYDTNPGGVGGNFAGRLTYEWTQFGTCPASLPSSGYQTLRTVLSYDAMGRTTQEQQCNLGNCVNKLPYNATYSYDLVGNETSYTNGLQGLTFFKAYDAGGRLQRVQGSQTDLFHAVPLYSVEGYAPLGAVQNMTLGMGTVVTKSYDKRSRPISETAVHP